MLSPTEIIEIKQEIGDTYDLYTQYFELGDTDNLHSMCVYPLSMYFDDELKQYDTFPINVNEYKRDTGYDRTINAKIEVVAVSRTKAHLHLREALRVKKNGDPIEIVNALYIWIKLQNKWKMNFISVLATPID